MAYAIVKAFGGDKGQKPKPKTAEDEEVIDTTSPDFAKNFQGFTYAKSQPPRRPQQGSTEILFG